MLISLRDTLFVWLQYLLPQHLISRLTHRLTRLQIPWLKNLLIHWFIHHFRVDMQEAQEEDYRAYPDFNHFFTRTLKPDARPLVTEPDAVLSPVDGTVSQAGHIEGEALFQAKGHRYSLATLLGHSEPWPAAFENGEFTTLYLSPRDYHRIHMPRRGVLREMIHVPGRLFSVNPATTRSVPGLFARNERVICLFDSDAGPMALVLVGAINVGSIETVWAGEVTPPAGRRVRRWHYVDQNIELTSGAEMGRFNMGSTVIVLFGEGRVAWEDSLKPDTTVRMGQKIGRVLAPEERG